ncbi:MAG: restriction endonuclease subunit S [Myxococcales bacterium]|nr:restriction endonuclease subunit S [Myxococcales bacterium]
MTPEGWTQLPVLDACEKVGRVPTVPRSQYRDLGKIPVIDQGQGLVAGFTDDEQNQYPGLLPVVLFGDHTREWKFITFPFAVGADGTQLLRVKAQFDQRFVFEALRALPLRNLGYSRHFKLLREMEILLPPIHEQRKIAAILSSVDDAIEATQAVIEQLAVVKKAMMDELLTRGLPGRHKKFKMTEIGEVPEEWEVATCGDLFEVQLGKMMSQNARTGANQLPYLRNENVYWHRLDLSDVSTMAFDERERAKFRLRKGDLLACEGRHIGRCAVWNGELDECYYQKALHRLRPTSDAVTTGYMKFFMALRFRYQADLVAEANSTSTIPHLPRERLVALPMWFPSREEQDEIVELLDALLLREAANEAVLDRLAGLKSALMSVLLTGEVRVNPDEAAA